MSQRYDKATNGYLFSQETEKLARRTCSACGDPTGTKSARMASLRDEGRWPHKDEWLYCQECADEKFRHRLSTEPARTFPSGAGCPLERSDGDDPSPWGENNVRILEGD